MALVDRLLRSALGSNALRPVLGRLKQAYADAQRLPQAVRQDKVDVGIPETTPLDSMVGPAISTPARLNVIVPALSQKHFFGGLATALRCVDRLRAGFACTRIIVTDEQDVSPPPGHFFSHWPAVKLRGAEPHNLSLAARDHVVVAGDRWGCGLPVLPQDVFMVTSWWTAHLAFDILDWQDNTFGPSVQGRRLLYLIQDYEPGFYPWSSRHVLAHNTYRRQGRTLALFNTAMLQQHFARTGLHFEHSWTLEPRLNPQLAQHRRSGSSFAKERIVLVYGRPSTQRNAFEIILAGLRRWAVGYPQASGWQVLSVGESFGKVELGGGCTLVSLEKLPLEDYADLLQRSALGVSLMCSPHPSYPPLEMAAFGLQVVTNAFEGKDLSHLSPQFHSLDPLHPAALAQALIELSAGFDGRQRAGASVSLDQILWNGPFLQDGPELAHVQDIVTALRSGAGSPVPHAEV